MTGLLAGEPTGARVAGNAVWLTAAEGASKLASIALVLVVARALGVQEYGWFTFATAAVPLLLILGSLGVHQVVVRDLVRHPGRAAETFASGLVLRVGTGVLAVAAAAGLAPLVLEERLAVLTVVGVGVALLLDSTAGYYSCILEAQGSVRHYAIGLIVNRFGSAGLALAAYLAGEGLLAVVATYVVGSAAGSAYVAVSVRRAFPGLALRHARLARARALLRDGVPLGVAGLLNMALLRLDIIMIAAVLGAVPAGLYGVAFRFYESFLFVTFGLGDATYPRHVQLGPGPLTARLVEATTALATAAYVPLFVLSLFAAPWAVTLLVGERYAEAASAVPWLTLATVAFGVTYQARSAAVGTGARGELIHVAVAALVVKVAANLALLPTFGLVGAAAATTAAAGVEALLTARILRRRGVTVRYARVLVVPVLAGALAGGVLAGLDLDGGPAVALGLSVYAVLLAAGTRLLPAEQRASVVRLVRRR